MDEHKHACNFINRVGEIGYTRFGTPMKIIEYNSGGDITIEFQDEHRVIKHCSYGKFILGSAKNPYDKSIYREGYIGEYAPTKINKKEVKAYRIWTGIIRRCYSDEIKNTHVAYEGCSVSEEWKNYSNFYTWYTNNFYNCSSEVEVDKDIFINNNKVYSEQTCLIVPGEINKFCQKSKNIGCYPSSSKKRWYARLQHSGEMIHIGVFDDTLEAQLAFLTLKNKIFQDLVDKYRKEVPPELYTKLKSSTIVG